jgi:hypothetical protein
MKSSIFTRLQGGVLAVCAVLFAGVALGGYARVLNAAEARTAKIVLSPKAVTPPISVSVGLSPNNHYYSLVSSTEPLCTYTGKRHTTHNKTAFRSQGYVAVISEVITDRIVISHVNCEGQETEWTLRDQKASLCADIHPDYYGKRLTSAVSLTLNYCYPRQKTKDD